MPLYKFLSYFFVALLFGCSSANQINKRFTPDDTAVSELIQRIKKNNRDDEAIKLLPDAYWKATEQRMLISNSSFMNMNEGDQWMEVAKELAISQQFYNEITQNAVLAKLITNPWNPAQKIQEAKQKAAEKYYELGIQYMSYNNRPYAEKAFDMFTKAEKAYPGYRDTGDWLFKAKELATIKVIVRPVNYNNIGWQQWGFENDFLQYRMVRDLNSTSAYEHVRFYTDRDAYAGRIRTDKIVELNFNDLFIGSVASSNNTIQRSKQIQTGETASIPPKPVYETVRATVYVTRKILQSRATLDCRIYDWITGSILLSDRFPDSYSWRHEYATYSGDRRALEPSDWNLINGSPGINAPARNDLATRLINNCYNQLLSRIRSGVKFN